MRGPRARRPPFRSFTTALIRDYQAHMATRRWSNNTVRRRLVELNGFAGWLVERRYLQRSPMLGISVPRREHRLPGHSNSSHVEQIVAGDRKPLDRAHPRPTRLRPLLTRRGDRHHRGARAIMRSVSSPSAQRPLVRHREREGLRQPSSSQNQPTAEAAGQAPLETHCA